MCPRYEPLLPKHAAGVLSEFDSLSVSLHLDRCEDCRSAFNLLIRGRAAHLGSESPVQVARDAWLRERLTEIQRRKSGSDWDTYGHQHNWVIRQWRAASGPLKAVVIGTACALAVSVPAWQARQAPSEMLTAMQISPPPVPAIPESDSKPAASKATAKAVAATPVRVRDSAPVKVAASRPAVPSSSRARGTPRAARVVTARPVSPAPAPALLVLAAYPHQTQSLPALNPVDQVAPEPRRQYAVITGAGSEPLLVAVEKPTLPPPVYAPGSTRPKAMFALITGASAEPILVKVTASPSTELIAASE